MSSKKNMGSRFVGYYNLLVSIFFIIGAIILISFSWNGKIESKSEALLPLFLLGTFGLFCGYSALKYLRHEKTGEICLIFCFIVQIVYSVYGLIATYKTTSSVSIINLIMLGVGLWGTWYLMSAKSKEWIN